MRVVAIIRNSASATLAWWPRRKSRRECGRRIAKIGAASWPAASARWSFTWRPCSFLVSQVRNGRHAAGVRGEAGRGPCPDERSGSRPRRFRPRRRRSRPRSSRGPSRRRSHRPKPEAQAAGTDPARPSRHRRPTQAPVRRSRGRGDAEHRHRRGQHQDSGDRVSVSGVSPEHREQVLRRWNAPRQRGNRSPRSASSSSRTVRCTTFDSSRAPATSASTSSAQGAIEAAGNALGVRAAARRLGRQRASRELRLQARVNETTVRHSAARSRRRAAGGAGHHRHQGPAVRLGCTTP